MPTIYTPPQFHAIRNSHSDLVCPLGTCVNTVGDTISMVVEPWFSHEVGTDFLKWENGGILYYDMGVWERQALGVGALVHK